DRCLRLLRSFLLFQFAELRQELGKRLILDRVALVALSVDELIDAAREEDHHLLFAPIRRIGAKADEISVFGTELLERGRGDRGIARVEQLSRMVFYVRHDVLLVVFREQVGIDGLVPPKSELRAAGTGSRELDQ